MNIWKTAASYCLLFEPQIRQNAITCYFLGSVFHSLVSQPRPGTSRTEKKTHPYACPAPKFRNLRTISVMHDDRNSFVSSSIPLLQEH